ncbi:MAG TPA: undecaprenyldiphospho-muramoylpentapeptide beta-N-acetylglucosaminyltransferase [Anaerolineae bacterium]|nr:undecaprenyldiphospho-muramoylpentapeptide beta-N-acetylglucosaminyltransferase [Anaerolineae bacterium]
MRLWIAAGGTGGHVYPALAVVERIRVQGLGLEDQKLVESAIPNPQSEIIWIGGQGGVEESLVARANIPFIAIPAGGLHGVAILPALSSLIKLIAGTVKSMQLIGRYRPNVMFTTGGFVAAPVAVACWLRRVPVVEYLPDIEPGLAVKFVARLATKIGVTTADSIKYFQPGKVVVTGYPTRLHLAQADRAAALERFELDRNRKTLLVFGGSKGARSINRAIGSILPDLLEKYQIIHISGSTDAVEVQARRDQLPENLKAKYHLYEYVHDMGLALAAADLAVSRAGASILGEYPLFGLPSILIPYPYAWRYQKVNADYLASRGAAIRLSDDETLSVKLPAEIDRLLQNDAELQAMRVAARSLARPDAAGKLANEIQSAYAA